MSTKCTLSHSNEFHFYRESLDDDHVYLEMNTTRFEAGYGRVLVPIPIRIWETIRHLGGARLDLIEVTDEQLVRMVEQEVDRRSAEYVAAERVRAGGGDLLRIAGCLVYGFADEARAEQIVHGVEYLTAERKRQREVQVAISALRSAICVEPSGVSG
jgi:hypothetical protein